MQSSLVKPSAISSRKRQLQEAPHLTRDFAAPPVSTQSPGHLLPHNPTIMSTLVAQHLSAGTLGGWSVEACCPGGICSTIGPPTMALQKLALRQKSIQMFSYHILLQGSERQTPVTRHTKYRPPISMDSRSYSWFKGAH